MNTNTRVNEIYINVFLELQATVTDLIKLHLIIVQDCKGNKLWTFLYPVLPYSRSCLAQT